METKLEDLSTSVRVQLTDMRRQLDDFEKEALSKIEDAKIDAMRTAVEELAATVNKRLTVIEQQLADMKDEE